MGDIVGDSPLLEPPSPERMQVADEWNDDALTKLRRHLSVSSSRGEPVDLTYINKFFPGVKRAELKQKILKEGASVQDRERVIAPTMREPDVEKKAAMRKAAAEEKLPAKFAILESFLSLSGGFSPHATDITIEAAC